MRWGLTSAQEETRRRLKKQGLQTCLDMLSFCATKCSNAQTLVETVRTFQQLLDGRAPSSTESPRENFSPAVATRKSSSDSGYSFSHSHPSTVPFPSRPPTEISSSLISEGMRGAQYGSLATTLPNQTSTAENTIPLQSSSSSSTTTYPFNVMPWSGTNRQVFYRTNLDDPILCADQSAQLPRMEPHHFQSFLQGFNPTYQDPREVYPYHHDPPFGPR